MAGYMYIDESNAAKQKKKTEPPATISKVLQPSEVSAMLGTKDAKPKARANHPPHMIKTWMAVYKGRTFRVTQMPRCEHMETVITYNPSGETLAQAKKRLAGVSVCTGSFHNPRTMALADFLQKNGSLLSSSKTCRYIVSNHDDGKVVISRDFDKLKRKPGVSALALGQRLVPLEQDGFSKAFMNRVTGRMALGVNNSFIFVVQGKSDIWKLAAFMQKKLPINSAINSDGGHVLAGKAPVHIVFRWKKVALKPCVAVKPKPIQTQVHAIQAQPVKK